MSAKSDGPPLPADPSTIDPPPDPGATYWTNAYRDRPRLRPNDGAPPLGILADPAAPMSLIGIAYPRGHVGGVTLAMRPENLADAPPPEVTWVLILDRAWVDGRAVRLADKRTLDGRFVLRRGRFVELAEDAE